MACECPKPIGPTSKVGPELFVRWAVPTGVPDHPYWRGLGDAFGGLAQHHTVDGWEVVQEPYSLSMPERREVQKTTKKTGEWATSRHVPSESLPTDALFPHFLTKQ